MPLKVRVTKETMESAEFTVTGESNAKWIKDQALEIGFPQADVTQDPGFAGTSQFTARIRRKDNGTLDEITEFVRNLSDVELIDEKD